MKNKLTILSYCRLDDLCQGVQDKCFSNPSNGLKVIKESELCGRPCERDYAW